MTAMTWVEWAKLLIAAVVICGLFFGLGCIADYPRNEDQE